MIDSAAWKIWLLRGLHFLMALSVPLVLTVMLSCMKATAQKEDLGPEVPLDAVNAALTRVASSASLNSLAIGQYLLFADTRRVENGDTTIDIGGKKIEVIDRQDTTSEADFTMRITTATRLPDSTFETTISEDSLTLDKVASVLTAASGQANLSAAPDPTVPPAPRVAFYHLQESDGVIPAPPTVAAKPGCGGLPDCNIHLHYIHFDIVTWQTADAYTKETVDLGFSTQTPYIPVGQDVFDQLSGLLVVKCFSSYIPVNNQSIYVRDCATLDDFQK